MPFTRENQPARRGKGPAPGSLKVPALLRDLRWAYEHLGEEGKGTPQQELFREMYAGGPVEAAKFLSLYTKQEELWSVSRGKAVPEEKAAEGPLEDEPMDVMIRQLLEGYRNAVA